MKGGSSEKFDRAARKSMQHTMTDSTKFVDMLHNVSWEDGLSDEVVYGQCNKTNIHTTA